MGKAWMIYGANGYTGKLTAALAKARGAAPILAGRTREAIEPLAREHGFEWRVFDLADRAAAVKGLEGCAALLNCAGPFSATAAPTLEACCAAKAHYLDITGEIGVFEYVHQNSARWKAAGIVAMPGVGFDVVPSDCLAAMLKRALPSATHLRMAFHSHFGRLSPGTTKTMVEGLPEGGKIRKDGVITPVPSAWKTEKIDFAGHAQLCVTIPWGDVSTAYYSTGIPNIEIMIGTSPGQLEQMRKADKLRWLTRRPLVQKLMKWQIGKKVKGPTPEQRAKDEMLLWGEATDGTDGRAVINLRTKEGYDFTAESGLASALRVIDAGLAPGAYTPSMAFGADYVLEIEGSRITG